MVVDESEEREIKRGEEEGPGPTPDRKGDDVDEGLEGEHGKEPEEGFHLERDKKQEEGRRRNPWSLVFPRREAPASLFRSHSRKRTPDLPGAATRGG